MKRNIVLLVGAIVALTISHLSAQNYFPNGSQTVMEIKGNYAGKDTMSADITIWRFAILSTNSDTIKKVILFWGLKTTNTHWYVTGGFIPDKIISVEGGIQKRSISIKDDVDKGNVTFFVNTKATEPLLFTLKCGKDFYLKKEFVLNQNATDIVPYNKNTEQILAKTKK